MFSMFNSFMHQGPEPNPFIPTPPELEEFFIAERLARRRAFSAITVAEICGGEVRKLSNGLNRLNAQIDCIKDGNAWYSANPSATDEQIAAHVHEFMIDYVTKRKLHYL